MRIRKITLTGYKRFKPNKIKTLVAEFKSAVTVIVGSNGSGKAQPVDDPIKVPGGWKRMGDIKVNDFVTAVDGMPARVTGVYPQGTKPLYRVKFVDGRYLDVPKEHLWKVYDDYHPNGVITSTDKLFIGANRGMSFYIDTAVPEQTPKAELPIKPYLLGAILAKCDLRCFPIRLYTKASLLPHIKKQLPDNTQIRELSSTDNGRSVVTELLPIKGERSGVDQFLYDYGLARKKDIDKFIPKRIYEKMNVDQRYEFLQGVFDSIGFCQHVQRMKERQFMPHFTLAMLSPRLADDIQSIVYSLGGVCGKSTKRFFRYYQKQYVPSSTATILSVRFVDPFKACNEPEKKFCLKTHVYGPHYCRLKILSVTALPTSAKCQCIMIDHPTHLYVTRDYIVTHNTSLLNELSPLPAVRTDFEKDGYKELEIEHEGHIFNLISDFKNKNSPHSFLVDGRELNIGHTTDVQEELVQKHFGFTSGIRDLIYNKIRLSQTTKSERRNLFLRVNPMDLSLIVDTHKKVLSTIKDFKAQLNLLQSRKVDLEGKMISSELLTQHKETRENLKKQEQLLQEIMYALWQHCDTIATKFKDDIAYIKSHGDLIPSDKIIYACKQLRDKLRQFTHISRGKEFYTEKEELRGRQVSLKNEKDNLSSRIANLSKEINEFQLHLEQASDRPISKIENEIQVIDEKLKSFDKFYFNPIPEEMFEIHEDIITQLEPLIRAFVNAGVPMIAPDKVTEKSYRYKDLGYNIKLLTDQCQGIRDHIATLQNEYDKNTARANIPDGCTFKMCGLRSIFKDRISRITDEIKTLREALQNNEQRIASMETEYRELDETIKPFITYELVNKFNTIKSLLINSYFDYYKNDEELIQKINFSPLKILEDLAYRIKESKLRLKYERLVQRKTTLETELATMMKTSGASLDFLKTELAKKENEVKEKLHRLNGIVADISAVDSEYNLYLEYTIACDKIHEFQEIYSKGERGLLIKNAYKYWNGLRKHYEQIQHKVREELRDLESIVKEQELIHYTYNTEIIPQIEKIKKEKAIYERLELALSPNSGIPHRSMVKYLNVMIHNVNYFLSQIWSYSMKLDSVDEGKPLDYGFPISIKSEHNKDISCTSDGQAEVIDLVWVLTILLQMKLLNKIPFFADEIGRCMDEVHRGKTLEFLNSIIDNGLVEQLFLINHYAAISNGFKDCNVVCLNSDNLTDLPTNTNQYVEIINY